MSFHFHVFSFENSCQDKIYSVLFKQYLQRETILSLMSVGYIHHANELCLLGYFSLIGSAISLDIRFLFLVLRTLFLKTE